MRHADPKITRRVVSALTEEPRSAFELAEALNVAEDEVRLSLARLLHLGMANVDADALGRRTYTRTPLPAFRRST
jgi:predicted transcriptional regulator